MVGSVIADGQANPGAQPAAVIKQGGSGSVIIRPWKSTFLTFLFQQYFSNECALSLSMRARFSTHGYFQHTRPRHTCFRTCPFSDEETCSRTRYALSPRVCGLRIVVNNLLAIRPAISSARSHTTVCDSCLHVGHLRRPANRTYQQDC